MANPAAIRAYLLERYPDPPPDPNWVTECHSALLDAGHPSTAKAVEEQYLYSDLGTSTLPSPRGQGIPSPDETDRHNGVIFRSPVIVQIHSVNDVGVSAFALNRTLEERRDVLSGATRIRRMDDEDDEDEGKDGKVPPYPRSMLSMEVSDGRTAMRAIEYRRIDGLQLAETPLGTKLRLQNVKCLKGTLLLTPDNTEVLGGAVDALECDQGVQFVESLQARLDAARSVPPASARQPAQRRRTLPMRTARSTALAQRAPAVQPTRPPTRTQTSDAARAARRAALLVPHPPSDTTLADDSFEVDDSFIQHLDAAEAAATQRLSGQSQRRETEVIEISDSD